MKPRLLYKYCPAESLEPILQNCDFLVKSPKEFNDPFEIRPYFDNVRKETYDAARRANYSRASPNYRDELKDVPVDNILDYDTRFHEQLVEHIDSQYRILCLSKRCDHILMWSHYAQHHHGFVIGVDIQTPGFHGGLDPRGYDVNYNEDRLENKMPLSFYRLRNLDIDGRPVVSGNQMVESDGGLIISASERSQIYEDSVVKLLTNKYRDWSYEKEVRFIFRTSEEVQSLSFDTSFSHLKLPPEAFRTVVVGYRTPLSCVKKLVARVQAGTFPNLQLFLAHYHPSEYRIGLQPCAPDYLLDFYRDFKPQSQVNS